MSEKEIDFSGNLCRIRKEKGVSQIELAKLAGMTQRDISMLENGRVPNIYTLKRIATALDCPVDDLLK